MTPALRLALSLSLSALVCWPSGGVAQESMLRPPPPRPSVCPQGGAAEAAASCIRRKGPPQPAPVIRRTDGPPGFRPLEHPAGALRRPRLIGAPGLDWRRPDPRRTDIRILSPAAEKRLHWRNDPDNRICACPPLHGRRVAGPNAVH